MENNKKVNPYSPTPWSLYDRITSAELKLKDHKKKIYTGICIGERQIMGLKDHYVVPILTGILIIALGFAFINLFLQKDEKGQIVNFNAGFLVLESFFLILGAFVMWFTLFQTSLCYKYNKQSGMGAVYLNPEERTIGVKDIQGEDLIIPLDKITSVWRLNLLSITFSGVGFKIFPRLVIHYLNENNEKKFKIIHFLDDQDYVLRSIELVRHEYLGESKEEKNKDKKKQ